MICSLLYSTGSYLPTHIVTNENLTRFPAEAAGLDGLALRTVRASYFSTADGKPEFSAP